MIDMFKIVYPNGFCKQVEGEKDRFYAILNHLKETAVSHSFAWESYYAATTYVMADGSKYVYREDTEYGIPYSIEQVA